MIPSSLLDLPNKLQRLQVEITTWCNLKCVGCPRTIGLEGESWQNRHMPVDTLNRVLDNLPPSQMLCLQGIGEPTLHPDLYDLVRLARAKGKYGIVTFNSNVLARDLDYWRELKRIGLRHVSISVDSLTQEVAERCRAGTRVDKLRERLRQLSGEGFAILVSIVLSRLNLHDLAATLREIDRIGRFGVEIQPFIDYSGGSEASLDAADIAAYRRLMAELRPALRNIVALHEAAALKDGPAGEARCLRPFVSPYVTVDGYLTPCCTTEDAALFGYARADETPFADIWRSPAVQSWLAAHWRGESKICVGCAFNPAAANMPMNR